MPENKNVIGCRWLFKVKRSSDGKFDRFKARLVAQGYTQEHGIEYQEVYAPVIRYSAIRSLLALANHFDLEIHQLNVKTAFLQGTLDTEIYMKQPRGYTDKTKPDYVCRLKRSIYGLKKSARCCNTPIDNYLKSDCYITSGEDTCLYTKSTKAEDGKIHFVILALYVDDILLVSNSSDMMTKESVPR